MPVLSKGIAQMPWFRACAVALAATLLFGAPIGVFAQNFSEPQRAEIETIIRNYLLAHPEVLEEVTAELTRRQTAAEDAKHLAAVQKNAEVIFNSPRGVQVAGANGDVNFVEFFDYNCGYCKRAMTDMLALMKEDSRLKVTLKEFPVLG